ncbi:hypothetical protein Q8W71_07110 [Methylobacterium sp. NEAU 140]|uniref:hypothetical protein n=1 Tax=Methylobacterium sp. NEAU 140 TaxID=3064945 RepID=UPI0027347B0F|nr:hypothetical protein [Methylobacterium sp. NEAU 140]MDP4022385.1 hypothetical protein [Methylobacterium sp. NEAU 140]
MPNDLRTEADVSGESTLLLLKRIGTILGLPTHAFFDEPDAAAGPRADIAATGELLRLWASLRSDRDRSAVLGFLRDRALARAE